MDITNIYKEYLTWYNCGPTIYSRSHLGHARTFIIFDAMRRYFERRGVMIRYVMNITDIDDKIVNRVHYQKYRSVLVKIVQTFGSELVISNGMTDEIANDPNKVTEIRHWLLNQKLATLKKDDLKVTHRDYQEYIDRYNEMFWDDMESIGVSRPDIITKVSDNMNNIIKYIRNIISNGLAYVSNGSVYFDSEEFIEQGYDFAPLRSGTKHDDIASARNAVGEKKSPADFALWKAEKEYDISFESPWGRGRPGWHIECSAMIHETIGSEVNVHTGGIDLKFPHHNNECIQTWAHNGRVEGHPEFYMHTGHLHINKEKMSQSLGNVISIEGFLKKIGTARQMRLMFFYHKWDEMMEYTDGVMEEVKYLDKRFQDFINHLSFLKRENQMKKKLDHEDDKILEHINSYGKLLDSCLDKGFDTSSVLLNAETTIDKVYAYLEGDNYDVFVVRKADMYMRKISDILGLDYYGTSEVATEVSPYIDMIVKIRDIVRDTAKTVDGKENRKKLFAITDQIRDVHLKDLGVTIEDRGLGRATKWF